MQQAAPLSAAQALVTRRCPDARQASLSGSVVTGDATPSSDLVGGRLWSGFRLEAPAGARGT